MMRILGMVLLALTVGLLAMITSAAVESRRDLDEPLEALHPSSPMEYFELAEEIADAAQDQTEQSLARHLFALAGCLDPERLGRSACLAIASIEDDAHATRRLLALAGLLGSPGLHPSAEQAESDEPVSGAAAMRVCEAFSFYRRGRGDRALALLDDPQAMKLLRSLEHLMPGGAERFLEDCQVYRRGDQKPSLLEQQLTRMLLIEQAILSSDQRTWSADLLLNQGNPLAEVDPGRLDLAFGVDASRTVYRNGAWVHPSHDDQ